MTTAVVINDQYYHTEDSYLIIRNCQAQGPTLGPTQGRVKVKVRTWSGHGQVSYNSNSNSNSKVGPELYTKIGFHHHHHHPPTPSLNECLVNFVTLCDTL